MAQVKIIDWEQRDSIGVDPSNAESKVDKTGTIQNPIPTSHIHVHILVDGVRHMVVIKPPYSRAKVITKIKSEILSKMKEDEGKEFTVTL